MLFLLVKFSDPTRKVSPQPAEIVQFLAVQSHLQVQRAHTNVRLAGKWIILVLIDFFSLFCWFFIRNQDCVIWVKLRNDFLCFSTKETLGVCCRCDCSAASVAIFCNLFLWLLFLWSHLTTEVFAGKPINWLPPSSVPFEQSILTCPLLVTHTQSSLQLAILCPFLLY